MSNTTLGAMIVILFMVLGFAVFQKDIMKMIKGERKSKTYSAKTKKPKKNTSGNDETVSFTSKTTFGGDGKGGIAVDTKVQKSGNIKMPKVNLGKCKHIPKMLRKCRPFECNYQSTIPLWNVPTFVTRKIIGMKDGKCKFEEKAVNVTNKKGMGRLICHFPKSALKKFSNVYKIDRWTVEYARFIDMHTYPMSEVCKKIED